MTLPLRSRLTTSLPLFTLSILALCAPTPADGQMWERVIGTPVYDSPSSLVQTADDGYATFGSEFDDCCCPTSTDSWFMKLLPTGAVDFRISIDIDTFDWGSAVREVSDSAFGDGYIVAGQFGNTLYWKPGNHRMFLARLDSGGNVQWIYTYDDDLDNDYLYQMDLEVVNAFDPASGAFVPTGYVVTGTRKLANGENEGWVLSTDLGGTMNWMSAYRDTRFMTGTSSNTFVDIEQAFDLTGAGFDGFVVTGTGAESQFAHSDSVLFFIDSTGAVIWEKFYGHPNYSEHGFGVTTTSDGRYVMTRRAPQNTSAVDPSFVEAILKVDEFLDPVWQVHTTGMNLRGPIMEHPSGDLSAIGWANNTGTGWPEMMMTSIDSVGTGLWTRLYNGPDFLDSAISLDVTSDLGYAVLGQSGYCCHDYYVVKTDDQGITNCESSPQYAWTDLGTDFGDTMYQRVAIIGQTVPPYVQVPVMPNEQDNCEENPGPPPPPVDLTAVVVASTAVDLSWTNTGPYDSIQVDRDGVVIAVLGGDEVQYTDDAPPPGGLEYKIRAIAGGVSESDIAAVAFQATDVVYINAAQMDGGTSGTCELADLLEDAGRHPCSAGSSERFLSYMDDFVFGQTVYMWVQLGTYPHNYTLNDDEIEAIALMLLNNPGSALYIEGSDLGFVAGSILSDLTGVVVNETGSPDAPITQVTGLDAGPNLDFSGFSGAYTGEAGYHDIIEPQAGATPLFLSDNAGGRSTVFFDIILAPVGPGTPGGPDYRTIVTTTEFSGLEVDRPSLLDAYLLAFDGAPTPPTFDRGDCNADTLFNIADPLTVLSYLFGGSPIDCEDACDFNDDGFNNLGDAIVGLNAIFAGGPPPASPHGFCGEDLTADSLGCDAFTPCP